MKEKHISRLDFKKFILALFVLGIVELQAQKPIVTDEFDSFLVTKKTEVGEVIGKIELIEPNPNPTIWSLVKPVPGGDPRNYLKEGQLDATKVVEIDSKTGEIKLKKQPSKNPAHYYAEVRATNKEGFMEQVLIIIAKPEMPKLENALDIFTQRKEVGGLMFYATEAVDKEKIDYAANVANALLSKDRKKGGKIAQHIKRSNSAMVLFKTYEERNTSIGFFMYWEELGLNAQDLEDEEIIPDYLRLGGPRNIRRDASVEEITHKIHRGGIMNAYPKIQRRIEAATKVAVERGFYNPQDGLPLEDYPDEYLAFGLDIYYGVMGHRSFEGKALTPDNLKEIDPELYDILQFLFPSKEEFFVEMGWTQE
ncbi:hypothetical protein [Ulvibacterium sp.]|uniref:hypothetical protein n=1 Tax=Ulvibacterium sp. TaxID=2665914 RepID=UPI00260EA8A2|nr:hypothetical protein [Ulvibacterium sp.]